MEIGEKERKKYKWEEMFLHFPELKRVFAYYDRQIRFYNRYEWKEGMTRERLIQKRNALLDIATGIGNKELIILYYLKKLRGISIDRLLRLLQNLYQAEQALYGELQDDEEYCDIMQVASCAYKHARRGSVNNG